MKLTIYYDGACPVCTDAVQGYKSIDQDRLLKLVDISTPDFSPKTHGVDPVRVNQEMHALNEQGQWFYGLDALIQIWKLLPKYHQWASIADFPIVKPFFKVGYFIFARFIRPLISKKKPDCDTGVCRRNH